MLKKFLLRQMLSRQLKDVPEAGRERLMSAFEQNPELFERIARDVQEAVKNGKDQMTATLETVRKYQAELAAILNART